MSSAAIDAGAAPAKSGSKKKLLMIVGGVLVLLIGLGAGGMIYMQKKAAAEAAESDDGDAPAAAHAAPAKNAHRAAPTFVPLEPFTVNLADRDTERYAQIGVTLEVDDPKVAEELKTYMPAIRNNILMVLAHKTSTELLERAGKEALAAEILRESARPLGIEIEAEDAEVEKTPKTKKKKKAAVHNPLRAVNFSNFIIQ